MKAYTYRVTFTKEGKEFYEGEPPSTVEQDTIARAVEMVASNINIPLEVWDANFSYLYTKLNVNQTDGVPEMVYGVRTYDGQDNEDLDLFSVKEFVDEAE